MRTAPNDRAFVRACDAQIEGNSMHERVIFIDNDDEVREVVYASEFRVLSQVRERLEKSGVLKGVVHVAATVLGARDGHGPRYSTVEYLPDHTRYVRQHVIRPALWVNNAHVDLIQTALEATDKAFAEREEEQGPEGK